MAMDDSDVWQSKADDFQHQAKLMSDAQIRIQLFELAHRCKAIAIILKHKTETRNHI